MSSVKAEVLPLFPWKEQEQARETSRAVFLKKIVHEHGHALRLFLRVRIKQEQDREDIYQDVFLNLSKLPDLIERLSQQPESLRSYLFSIATNRIRDRIRQDRARAREQHEDFDEELHGIQATTPEQLLSLKQDCERIKRVLFSINPKHRQAFVLSRFEALSYQEISEVMNISVSTVEKYISSALYALRKE